MCALNRNKNNRVLIIGSLPPPFGGVTIHTQRLLYYCDKEKIDYTFISKNAGLLSLIRQIVKHRTIHLQISNIYVSFVLILFSRLLFKKIIITRHGDIDRNHGIKKWVDLLCVKYATLPILLNRTSYNIGIRLNRKAIQLSAFIPPPAIMPPPPFLQNVIAEFKKQYKYIFCTNAFNLAFDSAGGEIYGIIPLIELFRQFPDLSLVAATCNQNYTDYIKKKNIAVPRNVFIVDTPIDYSGLIKETDASIRNTSTDGDSLSIHESLYCRKPVFATDCVPRPEGTILFHDIGELKCQLASFIPEDLNFSQENAAYKIIKLYRKI